MKCCELCHPHECSGTKPINYCEAAIEHDLDIGRNVVEVPEPPRFSEKTVAEIWRAVWMVLFLGEIVGLALLATRGV